MTEPREWCGSRDRNSTAKTMDTCEPLVNDLQRVNVNSPCMNRLFEETEDGALILNPLWATFGREGIAGTHSLVRNVRLETRENKKPLDVLRADLAVARVRQLVASKLNIRNWDNVILAGGAVSRTVMQHNVSVPSYGEFYQDHDFDLYLYGLGDDEGVIAKRVRQIEREFEPDMVWRTDCVISMVKFSSHTMLQVILLKAETPRSVMQTFDVDESRAYFDGSVVWVTARWKEAVMNRCTTVRNELASPTLFERISKYTNHFGHRVKIQGLCAEEKARLVKLLGEFEAVVRQRIVSLAGFREWPSFAPKKGIVVLASQEWKKALVIDVLRSSDPFIGRQDTLRFGVRLNVGTSQEMLDKTSTQLYSLKGEPGLAVKSMLCPIRCLQYIRTTGHRTGVKVINRSIPWRFLDAVHEKRSADAIYAEFKAGAFAQHFLHNGTFKQFAKAVPASVLAENIIGNDFNERAIKAYQRAPAGEISLVLHPFPETIAFLISIGDQLREMRDDYDTNRIGYRVRSREEMFGAVGRPMEAFRPIAPPAPEPQEEV